tara:strand:+ start:4477 stop:5538 length:1062 start_codon:yes stop_codon:yes gene_type:complete
MVGISKRVDETSENLTGDQIQDIMDKLLYGALEPFVLYTEIFDYQISYMLGIMTQNKKRKLTFIDRDDAFAIMCQVLITGDRVKKFELIRQLGLERSTVHLYLKRILSKYRSSFLDLYLRNLNDPEDVDVKSRLESICNSLNCSDLEGLYLSFVRAEDTLVLYEKFIKSIVNEYSKLCHKSASKHISVNPSSDFDYRDVVQGLMQNVVIALNKYNADKGALTSHIKWWLLNAQTCNTSDHEYGIAFTIPQGQKKKLATESSGKHQVNFSVSLDSLLEAGDDEGSDLHSILGSTFNVETHIENVDLVNRVAALSKYADVNGLARLSLDIGEHFSKKERRKMAKHMIKYGISANL